MSEIFLFVSLTLFHPLIFITYNKIRTGPVFNIFELKQPIKGGTIYSVCSEFKDILYGLCIQRYPADWKGGKDHLRMNFCKKIMKNWCWPHFHRASDIQTYNILRTNCKVGFRKQRQYCNEDGSGADERRIDDSFLVSSCPLCLFM